MTWTRKPEEIKEALGVQQAALVESCKSYDLGNRWEAIRLATAVSVVVHYASRSGEPILVQLGVRGSLRFVSSGFPSNPRNLLRETNLILARISSDGMAEYVPLLDQNPESLRRVQFHHWWERDTIFRGGAFRLTRKNLVFALRNKEGGAHFDKELRDPN
jgi:hypothetical protein